MPSSTRSAGAVLRAADDLTSLAPDLGWTEATGLTDALVDALAHRCVDLAADREEPTTLPLVVGAIGGADGPVDHASCRAAAARLRALVPVVEARVASDGPAWGAGTAAVMADLADLLDQVAGRSRQRTLTRVDKGVTLRRLHGMHRQLR